MRNEEFPPGHTDPSTRSLHSLAQDDILTGLVGRARHHVISDFGFVAPNQNAHRYSLLSFSVWICVICVICGQYGVGGGQLVALGQVGRKAFEPQRSKLRTQNSAGFPVTGFG